MSTHPLTDTRRYRDVLGRFATGVTVISGEDAAGPLGFTCQSFASLSLEPALVMLSPQKRSTTWPRARAAGRFAVSVLAAGQRSVSDGFARSGSDKFAGVDWHRSPAGLPLIDGALAWIEAEIREEIDAGDHTIVIGEVTWLAEGDNRDPLLFFRGSYAEEGR